MPVNDALAAALVVSTGLAVWLAAIVRRRPSAPGAVAFFRLVVMTGWWCATSAGHAMADSFAAKIVWAKAQYLGISAVPLLWLLFAGAYAGATWVSRGSRLAMLSVVPLLTAAAAATNEWHRAMWPSVTLLDSGLTVYAHGWWFWVATATNYAYVIAGTYLITRALRSSPPPFRSQHVALIAAAALPLAANVVYVAEYAVPGIDPTPLVFVLSAVLFTWALFRHHLFELVPIARGMVVDSLDDAVLVVDAAGRVLDMNAAARRLANYDRPWLGRAVTEVLPFEMPHVRTLLSSGEPATVTSGDVHYDLRAMPIQQKAAATNACVLLVRDTTEQRRADAEREDFTRRIAEQQQRESLSVLAGGLAHDFNNLLAGIVGNADLLALKVAPSSEMGNSVGAILLGAQRAADLVDKMLAYAGERHGSTSRVELDHLVRDLLDLLQASAARHCAVHYEGTPALIDADATQIRQVAMNLIINAAEAVEEASEPIVRVRTGIERLSARQLLEMEASPETVPGTYAYLEVRDNGPGMTPDTVRRIFDPFFTTKATGHGLGLAAVQGIVRGHRGALRVDSTPGYGAKFCVWFPLAGGAPPANLYPEPSMVEA